MAGHNLLAIRTAIRHFHSDIFEKNIIPRHPHTRLRRRDRFRDPPRFETASMPFGCDGGLAKEPGCSFSNPDANRLRLRLSRLQIGSFPEAF